MITEYSIEEEMGMIQKIVDRRDAGRVLFTAIITRVGERWKVEFRDGIRSTTPAYHPDLEVACRMARATLKDEFND